MPLQSKLCMMRSLKCGSITLGILQIIILHTGICLCRPQLEPITSVFVGSDYRSEPHYCPNGYDHIETGGLSNGDFNQGNSGWYIYLCYSVTQFDRTGEYIEDLMIVESSSDVSYCPGAPSEYSRIRAASDADGGDFCDGAGGDFIFLCAKYTTQRKRSIHSLQVVAANSLTLVCPTNHYLVSHTSASNGNFNRYVGGKAVWLCQSTPLPSPSPSATPSTTRMPSTTPSQTPSRTRTPTPSPTPTPSRSRTPTPSRTRTPTPSPTPTPSRTRTPTPSATPTPSRTRTQTPSATPTPSRTQTQTPSPTPSTSPSPSSTSSPSVSPSGTSSPSLSSSASTTPSSSGSPSPSSTPSQTPSITPTKSPSPRIVFPDEEIMVLSGEARNISTLITDVTNVAPVSVTCFVAGASEPTCNDFAPEVIGYDNGTAESPEAARRVLNVIVTPNANTPTTCVFEFECELWSIWPSTSENLLSNSLLLVYVFPIPTLDWDTVRIGSTSLRKTQMFLTTGGSEDLELWGANHSYAPPPFSSHTEFVGKGNSSVRYRLVPIVGGIEASHRVLTQGETTLVFHLPAYSKLCGVSKLDCKYGNGYTPFAVHQFVSLTQYPENHPWDTQSIDDWEDSDDFEAFTTDTVVSVVCPGPSCPLSGPGLYYSSRCSGYRFGEVCLNPSKSRDCAFGEGSDCIPCPVGAVCPGGYRAWPLPGYWNRNESDFMVFPCSPPATERCLGWSTEARRVLCGKTYDQNSVGCNLCTNGTYPEDGRCLPCIKRDSTIEVAAYPMVVIVGVLASVLLISVGVNYWLLRNFSNRIPKRVSLELSFEMLFWIVAMSQVTLFAFSSSAPGLPPGIRETINNLQLVRLDFSGLFPPSCQDSDQVFTGATILHSIAIGISVVLCVTLSTHLREVKALILQQKSPPDQRVFNDVPVKKLPQFLSYTVSLIGVVVFSRVADSVLKMVDCRMLQGEGVEGKLSILAGNSHHLCYSGPHLPAGATAWIALGVFCIGFPVLLLAGSSFRAKYAIFALNTRYGPRSTGSERNPRLCDTLPTQHAPSIRKPRRELFRAAVCRLQLSSLLLEVLRHEQGLKLVFNYGQPWLRSSQLLLLLVVAAMEVYFGNTGVTGEFIRRIGVATIFMLYGLVVSLLRPDHLWATWKRYPRAWSYFALSLIPLLQLLLYVENSAGGKLDAIVGAPVASNSALYRVQYEQASPVLAATIAGICITTATTPLVVIAVFYFWLARNFTPCCSRRCQKQKFREYLGIIYQFKHEYRQNPGGRYPKEWNTAASGCSSGVSDAQTDKVDTLAENDVAVWNPLYQVTRTAENRRKKGSFVVVRNPLRAIPLDSRSCGPARRRSSGHLKPMGPARRLLRRRSKAQQRRKMSGILTPNPAYGKSKLASPSRELNHSPPTVRRGHVLGSRSSTRSSANQPKSEKLLAYLKAIGSIPNISSNKHGRTSISRRRSSYYRRRRSKSRRRTSRLSVAIKGE